MGEDKHKAKERKASLFDGTTFSMFPHMPLKTEAFMSLSLTAKCLLLERVLQWRRTNNGRLVLCKKLMEARGWNSPSVILKAKKQLIELGFLFETRKGRMPNRTAWYALTFYDLPSHKGYDPDREIEFKRSAYLHTAPDVIKAAKRKGTAPGTNSNWSRKKKIPTI